MGSARGWLAGGAAAVLLAGGGCLQILGDDATFVLGTGGAGGESGGAGPGGNGGGTAGSGATGGGGGTTSAGVCMPGETRSCYSGPDGTEGVGECKAGTETCARDGSGWGECEGEVTPKTDDPTVVGDEACDGYQPGEFLCAVAAGGLGDQLAKATAVDPVAGDIFVAGTFEASAEFGADALVTVGLKDIFLAKFNVACMPEWAVQFGGQGSDDITSMAVDEDGNVLVAGSTTGTIDFGGVLVETPIYVAKFEGSTGANLWATGCASGQGTTISDLAVGSNGEVAATGQYFGTLNCGDEPHAANAMGDAFVSKFDGTTGGVVWSKAFAGAATESGKAVRFDPVGSLLVAGEFSGSINLGGSTLESTDFFMDVFVGKFAANGAHVWSTPFGGTGVQLPTAVAVDKLGSPFVSGRFEDALELGDSGTLTAIGNFDGFILKLTPNGMPEWGVSFGDNDTSVATDVAVDPAGDVILVGAFEGTVSLGGAQVTSSGSFTVPDGFVAKISGGEGTHIWSEAFGDYSSPGPWVGGDAQGNAAVCAGGNAPFDFGAGELSPTGADVFIARFAP